MRNIFSKSFTASFANHEEDNFLALLEDLRFRINKEKVNSYHDMLMSGQGVNTGKIQGKFRVTECAFKEILNTLFKNGFAAFCDLGGIGKQRETTVREERFLSDAIDFYNLLVRRRYNSLFMLGRGYNLLFVLDGVIEDVKSQMMLKHNWHDSLYRNIRAGVPDFEFFLAKLEGMRMHVHFCDYSNSFKYSGYTYAPGYHFVHFLSTRFSWFVPEWVRIEDFSFVDLSTFVNKKQLLFNFRRIKDLSTFRKRINERADKFVFDKNLFQDYFEKTKTLFVKDVETLQKIMRTHVLTARGNYGSFCDFIPLNAYYRRHKNPISYYEIINYLFEQAQGADSFQRRMFFYKLVTTIIYTQKF